MNGVKREPTGLQLRELKYKKTPYPQSSNSVLPRQYFVMAAIGPRGSGKTYGVCQLLKQFEREPPETSDGERCGVRTIVISPTIDANECFRSLRSLDDKDIYRTYTPSVLQEILESVEEQREEREQYQRELAAYRKFQKVHSPERLSHEELMILERLEFEPPERPKYPGGISTFLIIDDMVGSDLYKPGRNPFLNLLLRNRHHGINVVMMVQSLKSLPRTIRGNISVWQVHKFGARQFLPDLYDEIASGDIKSLEDFEQLYDAATAGPHDCLIVDFTKPKHHRYLSSWKEYITIG